MVSLCEDMAVLGQQINSYTDAKNNYSSSVNGSLFWYQARGLDRNSSVTSSVNSDWVIFGNGDYFYFMTSHTSNSGILRDMYSFGDIESLAGSDDRYCCMWQGAVVTNDNSRVAFTTNGSKYGGLPTTSAHSTGYFIKEKDGNGDLVAMLPSVDGGTNQYSSGYTPFLSIPNPTNSSLLGLPLFAKTDNNLRAYMPRLLAIPQSLSGTAATSDTGGFDCAINGDILTVAMHFNLGSIYLGYFGFDVKEG